MKKLAFISLAVLGFSGVNETVWGMNPSDEGQCSQNKCNYEEVKQSESEKGEETLCEVADISRNNPEMTAMIERIVKQAEDLQEQVKSLKEKTNRLTMQETFSSEAERIKQLEESLSPEEKRRLEEVKNEPTCCFPRPTPEQKQKERIYEMQIKEILEKKLFELEKERDDWMAYIDGRKKTLWSQTDSSEERMKMISIFYQEKRKAPMKLHSIDQEIEGLRKRLSHLMF